MVGDIVSVHFPFSDKPIFKQRPALVVSEADARGDFSVLKITSRQLDASDRIRLDEEHFLSGSLPLACAVVPHDLSRVNQSSVSSVPAKLKPDVVQKILKARICQDTRGFSKLAHSANRPGEDPLHPLAPGKDGKMNVPYAGRVFDEDEVEAAVSATLDFWLTLGPEGDAMQKELASLLGVKHCLLVNSGSSANLIAVSALTSHKLPKHKRIQPGDEVITCAAGFPTTVAPIIQQGAVPVFIDNDPITGNAKVEQLEAAYVEGKTKAVMFAHTLGNPFDLAAVCAFCHKYDLWLIEDNCDALGCTYTLPLELAKKIGLDHLIKQAVRVDDLSLSLSLSSSSGSGSGSGSSSSSSLDLSEDGKRPPVTIHQDLNSKLELLTAYTGSFGDISTQSFYPPHHLTMGEGGSVNIIRRPQLKLLAESFRDWGRDCWCASGVDNTCGKRFGWQLGELPEGYDHKYIYSHLGYNIKPLDTQAAIGRKQIEKLPKFIQARKDNWETLRRGLVGLEDVFEFSLPTHATGWTAESGFSWDESGCSTDNSWFGFMLLVKPEAPFKKSELGQYLDDHKIGNRMLFGGNLLRQPAFVQLKRDRPEAFRVVQVDSSSASASEDSLNLNSNLNSSLNSKLELNLPGADRIMNEAIFIGVYPGLTQAQLDYMVTTIQGFCSSKR